jgi:hypothetical protein
VFRRSRSRREDEPGAPGIEAADAGPSLQELSRAYEERVSDAAGLAFAHLMGHPEDLDLDLSRGGTQSATLYQAVAANFPRLHDLGLTPTMWARATSVALAAHREQVTAARALSEPVAELSS